MTHEDAVRTLATERYLLNEMTAPERDAFEDHYFSCLVCAEDIREAAVMQDGVKTGLLGTATAANCERVVAMPERVAAERFAAMPARPTSERVVTLSPRPRQTTWYQSAVIPWAAAATLAMVAGYQSLVLLPALRQGLGPRTLTTVTLRPASRGAEPTVPLQRDNTFALDVAGTSSTLNSPMSSAGELSYDLRTAAGTGVISGRVQAPAPGSPLLLLIPAGVIREPGHYVLSVAGTEYRFEAVR